MPLFPFTTLSILSTSKPNHSDSSELSDLSTHSTSTRPTGNDNSNLNSNSNFNAKGYENGNYDSSLDHLVGHARRQKNKAKELMKALRFNYFLYVPMLVLDIAIIGLMIWACTPAVRNGTYKDGKGRIGPLVLLICTIVCTFYTVVVLWRTKYKLGMPFAIRISGLVLITCPGYLVGTILLVQTSGWLPLNGNCGSLLSSDKSCSDKWGTLNAIELVACFFAALAAFLSAVDAANVITTHIVYSKRRNRS